MHGARRSARAGCRPISPGTELEQGARRGVTRGGWLGWYVAYTNATWMVLRPADPEPRGVPDGTDRLAKPDSEAGSGPGLRIEVTAAHAAAILCPSRLHLAKLSDTGAAVPAD
jgi:hypothetical protein